MDGLILAAGKGSRLGILTEVAPKALQYLPGGSSLLDNHIVQLETSGANTIFIVIGHLGSDIETYVKGRYPRCRLIRQDEEKLGTAADALLASEEFLHDDFVVVHGDHYFSDSPFASLTAGHQGC